MFFICKLFKRKKKDSKNIPFIILEPTICECLICNKKSTDSEYIIRKYNNQYAFCSKDCYWKWLSDHS